MTDFGQFFRYESGSLVPISDANAEVQLAAADSFLVDDGKVRSLQQHFDRFAAWVKQIDPQSEAQLEGFCEAVVDALPRTDRWFPRIEWHGEAPTGQHLYFRLREAPEQLTGITLWTADETDPRLQPTVKGPDLSLCQQLRRKANLHGADEAVLVDARGCITEGALSSIVWWNGDVLCAPDSSNAWIDSITRREVLAIAQQLGVEVRLSQGKPSDLIGHEVWVLGSLQGIRAVTHWENLGGEVAKPTHLDVFQRRLKLLAHQLP